MLGQTFPKDKTFCYHIAKYNFFRNGKLSLRNGFEQIGREWMLILHIFGVRAGAPS